MASPMLQQAAQAILHDDRLSTRPHKSREPAEDLHVRKRTRGQRKHDAAERKRVCLLQNEEVKEAVGLPLHVSSEAETLSSDSEGDFWGTTKTAKDAASPENAVPDEPAVALPLSAADRESQPSPPTPEAQLERATDDQPEVTSSPLMVEENMEEDADYEVSLEEEEDALPEVPPPQEAAQVFSSPAPAPVSPLVPAVWVPDPSRGSQGMADPSKFEARRERAENLAAEHAGVLAAQSERSSTDDALEPLGGSRANALPLDGAGAMGPPAQPSATARPLAPHARGRLLVVGGVPVGVEEHEPVGADEIDAAPTGSCTIPQDVRPTKPVAAVLSPIVRPIMAAFWPVSALCTNLSSQATLPVGGSLWRRAHIITPSRVCSILAVVRSTKMA